MSQTQTNSQSQDSSYKTDSEEEFDDEDEQVKRKRKKKIVRRGRQNDTLPEASGSDEPARARVRKHNITIEDTPSPGGDASNEASGSAASEKSMSVSNGVDDLKLDESDDELLAALNRQAEEDGTFFFQFSSWTFL